MKYKSYILFILWLLASISLSAEEVNKVLMILPTNQMSMQKELLKNFDKGLRDKGMKYELNLEFANIGVDKEQGRRRMQRICSEARKKEIDLIVTLDDAVFDILMHCGDSLAYHTPLLATFLKYPDYEFIEAHPNICALVVPNDLILLLEEAKEIFPNRKEIICLTDTLALDEKGLKAFERAAMVFQQKYNDYSYRVINLASTGINEIIDDFSYEEYAKNKLIVIPQWNNLFTYIAKNSMAPVFASQFKAITQGALCAHDAHPNAGMRRVGGMAAQILNGVSPTFLGANRLEATFLYDYKLLQNFDLSFYEMKKRGALMNMTWAERYFFVVVVVLLIIFLFLLGMIVWLMRTHTKDVKHNEKVLTQLETQKLLLEQRDEFYRIIGSLRDGLIVYDTDLNIRFINRALHKLLLLQDEEEEESIYMYGDKPAGTIFRIINEGENILDDLLCQVALTRKPLAIPDHSFMQAKENGVYFPVIGEVLPVVSDNELSGVAMLCHNIDNEEYIKRSFDMLIAENAIYPWQYIANEALFYISPTFAQMLDLESRAKIKITMKEWRDLIHYEDLSEVNEKFDKLINQKTNKITLRYRMRMRNGDYEWWEMSSSLYEGVTPDSPYMIIGFDQNIQRYKDAEVELMEAHHKALEAEKLKSAFVANMSHEIRTPLNSIVGFSELLKNIDMFSKEEVQQFVETIDVNSQLLLDLVNNVLDLSRIEAKATDFQMDDCHLTDFLNEMHTIYKYDMSDEVNFTLDCPAEQSCIVQLDATRIKQVFMNLIGNAKKFTTKGEIKIGYHLNEPGNVVLFVEDTGKGIPAESLPHIFERFYKVDSFQQGAGLGLSICQTIIEALQGTISVTSELGKGTRFEIRFSEKFFRIAE